MVQVLPQRCLLVHVHAGLRVLVVPGECVDSGFSGVGQRCVQGDVYAGLYMWVCSVMYKVRAQVQSQKGLEVDVLLLCVQNFTNTEE